MSSPLINQNSHPPKITEKLLTWCLPKSLKEPLVGDLSEEFSGKAITEGPAMARLWYFRQAFLTAFRYLIKTKRGLLMFIFGIFTFLGTLLMALIMSSELSVFVNIPSFLVVVPPALFITIGIASKETCKQALSLILDDELEVTLTELKSARQVFQVMGNTSVLLGILGLFIGLIAIAANTDPEWFSQRIGPALSVSLLTMLYASIVKILCYAGAQKIQNRIILVE